MEFVSSSTRSERQSDSSAARVTSWSSREGAGARRLLVSMVLLLVPARAGRMSAAKYKEATRALSDGAEWVIGEGAHYFWRAHAAMATPPAAGESWYLHSGSAQLPPGVQALIKKPDGTPATRSPDSAAMLNSRTSGGVVWPEHAGGHLLFPSLWAMLPPSCKRAVSGTPRPQSSTASRREEIDLNRDGMVTRYELYAGLAKLIRREQWHDTYANGLWVIPAA